MMKGLRNMVATAGSLLLIGLFVVAVAPARASVEERIKALEEELAQLKGEQMELRKEATAAKAKLPSFRYRPGKGWFITAADKSWAWRFFYRFYVYSYNNTDGNDARGASTMDFNFRRNRPNWTMWWEDGFYEIRSSLDVDTGTATKVNSQTAEFRFHLEKLNPFLPTIGIHDKGGPSAGFVARSSSKSAVVEYTRDLMTDSGVDTLSHRGISLLWNRVRLWRSGTVTLNVGYIPCPGCNKDTKALTDRGQFELVLGSRPFSKTKNKWLKKLKLGVNWKTGSMDSRGHSSSTRRIRLRETNRTPRVTIFEAKGIGDGAHNYWHYGVEWGVGPYLIRANGVTSRWEGKEDSFRGVHGRVFGIAHQLFIWSPKGPLTGKANKAGSLLVGYRFARADADCGLPGCDSKGGSERNHYYENEWDIWYWIRPALSVGIWVVHSNAANMRIKDQVTVGCRKNSATDPSKSCSWTSVNFGLRSDW
ncbi:MAG: hypothetical protein ACE5JU_00300 [Candidatus Binatia bacterium]